MTLLYEVGFCVHQSSAAEFVAVGVAFRVLFSNTPNTFTHKTCKTWSLGKGCRKLSSQELGGPSLPAVTVMASGRCVLGLLGLSGREGGVEGFLTMLNISSLRALVSLPQASEREIS